MPVLALFLKFLRSSFFVSFEQEDGGVRSGQVGRTVSVGHVGSKID